MKYIDDSFLRNLVELYERDPGVVCAKFGCREETLLHRAALHRRIEMVEFLLEHEARQVEDSSGNTPLHCAALGGDADVARALIEAGAELEVTSDTEEERRLCLGWEGRPDTRERRREVVMMLLIVSVSVRCLCSRQQAFYTRTLLPYLSLNSVK